MAQGNKFEMQKVTIDMLSEWITIKFTFLLDENLPSLPADVLFTALMFKKCKKCIHKWIARGCGVITGKNVKIRVAASFFIRRGVFLTNWVENLPGISQQQLGEVRWTFWSAFISIHNKVIFPAKNFYPLHTFWNSTVNDTTKRIKLIKGWTSHQFYIFIMPGRYSLLCYVIISRAFRKKFPASLAARRRENMKCAKG